MHWTTHSRGAGLISQAAICGALMTAFAACGDVTPLATPNGGLATPATDGGLIACASDVECPQGMTCVSNFCAAPGEDIFGGGVFDEGTESGEGDEDGEGEGGEGGEVSCTLEVDCIAAGLDGHVCVDGACVPPGGTKPECTKDSDCAKDEKCDKKKCVSKKPAPVACVSDADCAIKNLPDAICKNKICVEPSEGAEGTEGSEGSQGGPDTVPTTECADDSACPQGTICIESICRPLGTAKDCSTDSECTKNGPGFFCKGGFCTKGTGAPCEKAEDCAEAELCIDKRCVAEEQPAPEDCRLSADACGFGLRCNIDTGLCERDPEAKGALSIDPIPVVFDAPDVGIEQRKTLKLINVGDAPVRVVSVKFSATSSPTFSLAKAYGSITLGKSETLDVEVIYKQDDGLVDHGEIVIENDTDQASISVPCDSFYAGKPEFAIIDNSSGQPVTVWPDAADKQAVHTLAFPNTPVGSTASLVVNIQNVSAQTSILALDAASFAPQDAPFTVTFTVAGTPSPAPVYLKPGSSAQARIDFDPIKGEEGDHDVRLNIDTNDEDINNDGVPGDKTASIRLTGRALSDNPGKLEGCVTELKFGSVSLGNPVSKNLAMTNTGGEVLTIDVKGFTSGSTAFLVEPFPFPKSITAGGVIDFKFTFAPTLPGLASAVFEMTTSDTLTPKCTINVSGMGVDPKFALNPPPPWDFGIVPQGVTPSPITITLANQGIGDLEVTKVEAAPGTSPDFKFTNLPANFPLVLAQGAQTQIVIQYVAASKGPDSGALIIETSDPKAKRIEGQIVGEVSGCPQGFYDLDGDPNNGCEYPCLPSNNGVERCDGQDNNCNGEIDEGNDSDLCPALANATGKCDKQASVCTLTCDAEFVDFDKDFANGCECQVEDSEVNDVNNTCNAAATGNVIGQLPDGADGSTGSEIIYRGTIAGKGPQPGQDVDWFSFQAVDTPDNSCDNFHVAVKFTSNPNNAFAFDVYRGSCAPTDPADIAPNCTDYSWATDFPGPQNSGTGECGCDPPGSAHNGIDHVGTGKINSVINNCQDNSKNFFVKVYRVSSSPSCDEYVLQVTNGAFDTP